MIRNSTKIKIFILSLGLLLTQSVFAYSSPGKQTGYLNDFSGRISASDKAIIEKKLNEYHTDNGGEIVVVLLPTVNQENISTYANTLKYEWQLSQDPSKPQVFMVISIIDRQVSITTNQAAMESISPGLLQKIKDKVFMPEFTAERHAQAIEKTTSDFILLLTGEFPTDISRDGQRSFLDMLSDIPLYVYLIAGVIIIILISWISYGSRKAPEDTGMFTGNF